VKSVYIVYLGTGVKRAGAKSLTSLSFGVWWWIRKVWGPVHDFLTCHSAVNALSAILSFEKVDW